MEDNYDVIICGTGLKECILSGLLSVKGKKVLHVDRNGYYGGDCASLNLTNLWAKFKPNDKPPVEYGSNRDWNVDLIPKFVMACGNLVKLLIHTKVTRYLEWKSIDGTFVYQYQAAGLFQNEKFIHKVPATDMEALKSPLMGLLEKNRCKNFLQFVTLWNEKNSATWEGFDPIKVPMKKVYEYYGLQPDTIDFLGHAVALYTDDSYLNLAYGPTLLKMKLYMESISRYGNSPFIYPLYGLGGLPEGFSRLAAIHGGTFMLNKPVDSFVFDGDRCVGIRCGEEVAKAKLAVICDPSYISQDSRLGPRVRMTGKIVRSLCILGAPIPNTNNSTSCQIIIPQKQLNRSSDIFICMISNTHQICAKDKFIAQISTTVETGNPLRELEPAYPLLGKIENTFTRVSELYEPVLVKDHQGLFITKSYDASSHFESETIDVLEIWEKLMGEKLDLNIDTDLDKVDD